MKKTFQQRLEKTLKESPLRQEDLALIVKATVTTIQRWINGESEPSFERIELIAKTLNVSPQWLMGADEPGTPTDAQMLAYTLRKTSGIDIDPEILELVAQVKDKEFTKDFLRSQARMEPVADEIEKKRKKKKA